MKIIDRRQFILANTSVQSPPHVPEIKLYLADEAYALWQKTEDELEEIGLPPPFWAFAWAGGQGLARYVLDNPGTVRGKRVLDFASGSGIVAIAAGLAGASTVLANDIDKFCLPAISLNSKLNDCLTIQASSEIYLNKSMDEFDIVLAGDIFFDRAMTDAVLPWLKKLRKSGKTVLVGDPGRAYLPKDDLEALATYQVPVTRALEDMEVKKTTVWALKAAP